MTAYHLPLHSMGRNELHGVPGVDREEQVHDPTKCVSQEMSSGEGVLVLLGLCKDSV